jgi:hypothetical protein
VLSRPQTIHRNAPATARSASRPSTCQAAVCGAGPDGGKPDPPRVRDTRAGGAMVEATFGALAMAGGGHRSTARDGATPRGAVRVTAITRRTKSRTTRYRADTSLGEEGRPRRNNGALRLGTRRHGDTKSSDPSRSVGASRQSPRVWRAFTSCVCAQLTRCASSIA